MIDATLEEYQQILASLETDRVIPIFLNDMNQSISEFMLHTEFLATELEDKNINSLSVDTSISGLRKSIESIQIMLYAYQKHNEVGND